MPTIVTIKSTAPAVVISERIADRERFDNGQDFLEPDVEQSFVIHAGQSLRVVERPVEAAVQADVQPAAAAAETTEVQA